MKNKHPIPAGIPLNVSRPEKKIFCQKCGSDIDSSQKKSSNYSYAMSFCECGDGAFITNWVSIDSNIMHMMQGLNNLIIGESSSVQSSPNKNLFYEL
jgi:hypothetical protein